MNIGADGSRTVDMPLQWEVSAEWIGARAESPRSVVAVVEVGADLSTSSDVAKVTFFATSRLTLCWTTLSCDIDSRIISPWVCKTGASVVSVMSYFVHLQYTRTGARKLTSSKTTRKAVSLDGDLCSFWCLSSVSCVIVYLWHRILCICTARAFKLEKLHALKSRKDWFTCLWLCRFLQALVGTDFLRRLKCCHQCKVHNFNTAKVDRLLWQTTEDIRRPVKLIVSLYTAWLTTLGGMIGGLSCKIPWSTSVCPGKLSRQTRVCELGQPYSCQQSVMNQAWLQNWSSCEIGLECSGKR